MNKDDAVRGLMNSMSVIDTGIITALMLAQPEDWKEVTTPKVGDLVVLYDGDEEIDGEVHQLEYDTAANKYAYGVDIGEDCDVWLDDLSQLDISFDSVLPTSDLMFCPKTAFGDIMTDWWLENGGVEILSQIGFRVYKSENFGYFFGCDQEVYEDKEYLMEYFSMLYDEIVPAQKGESDACGNGFCYICGRSKSEVKSNDAEHVGLLICDKCGKSYCIGCLRKGVSDEAMKRMVWVGDTLLCPACANESGYSG